MTVLLKKKYTDESSLISWHYDHSTGKNVKGVNLLTAFYYSHNSDQELVLRALVSFELILKTQHFCDLKTKKERRKSLVTKNGSAKHT